MFPGAELPEKVVLRRSESVAMPEVKKSAAGDVSAVLSTNCELARARRSMPLR